jgi:hypothetical protein
LSQRFQELSLQQSNQLQRLDTQEPLASKIVFIATRVLVRIVRVPNTQQIRVAAVRRTSIVGAKRSLGSVGLFSPF